MRATGFAAMAALLLVSGCESRFNPVNWFDRGSQPEPIAATGETAEAETDAGTRALNDPRPLVDQVVSMQIDRVPNGVLVTAVGLPPTQGWFAAELIPEVRNIAGRPVAENGVMTFRFVAVPPPQREAVGNQASREVSAGVSLTNPTLAGTRSIVVKGARNQRAARP